MNTLEAIQQSWGIDTTAADPDLYIDTGIVSYGQCEVTALVLQDYRGGKIVRCNVWLNGEYLDIHYINEIDDSDIDLTWDQFPEHSRKTGESYMHNGMTCRQYLLSNEWTALRYKALKARVDEALSG